MTLSNNSEPSTAVSGAEEPVPRRGRGRPKGRASTRREHTIPRLVFANVCRAISKDLASDNRFSKDAFAALQSSSESFVVELFHSANNITRITNKTTLLSEHLRAVHTDVWRGIPPPERKKKKA